ncbi:MAG: amino acid adenylation domain-containing protein [Nostoc sp.]|uniref:non-ribosomal peptide synthetase n=1 Tax=Nostoc sp. TaxID=1180 RepID=UPI002FFCE925
MDLNFCPRHLDSSTKKHSEFALSHNQQVMWLLSQQKSENKIRHIFSTVRLCSALDIATWQKAWQKLGEYHPILRTNYPIIEGQPCQVVSSQADIDIKAIDASGWSEVFLQDQISEEIDRPFNFQQGSVLRVRLFTQFDAEAVQLAVIHPIAGDAWSFNILLNDFRILYTLGSKICQQTESISSKENQEGCISTHLQYVNFVNWQSEMLASPKGEQHYEFWKQQLAGEIPVLNLPLDRPRSLAQSQRSASHLVELDRQLLHKLQKLAQTEKASLYSVLLATLKVLLYRYTGQNNIHIGTPMAGRGGQDEFETIVGSFVNPVVLQSNLAGNPSFKAFLAQVNQTVTEAQDHQDYPFSLIMQQLMPQPDRSLSSLYQVFFTWDEQRWYSQEPKSVLSAETELNSGESDSVLIMKPYLFTGQVGALFDLSLIIWEVGNSIVLCWQYNADLFEADTIARIACHYQILLEGIVANPEHRVAELPLLSEAERHQLLVEWNDTQTPYPEKLSIQQLFEEQVERNPESVAVIYKEQQLTYRDLNQRANQLAHYLQTLGVTSETLVAICIERSLEMVVALLGILKAGGVYVPLDVTYPKERLAYILLDAQVSVLLTQQQLIKALPTTDAKVVILDSASLAIAKKSKENPIASTTADNLAYINYTSGSTGCPKGVAIPHRGVIRLLFGVDYVRLDSSRVHLQIAPIAFDAATFELWGALLHGARCVLFAGKLTTVQRIRDTINIYGVTTLFLTTALFNTIIDELPETFLGIQQLLTGGEAHSVGHIKKALEVLPSTEIISCYGPTESTTFTSTYPIPKTLDQNLSSIPIGRPIGNTQIYVLDTHLQLVPIGVVGELYVGGAGLARCYLNRPDLTQERFIPNPLYPPQSISTAARGSALRLYKTGDLVRYLPDGNIEFIGRIDNQVKIRGFRIEIGEIETLLAAHPKLRLAAVFVRENSYDDKQLVACVVPVLGQELTADELRNYLQQKLPNYMIPSTFILLETLPLTPNGKVDRRNLTTFDNPTLRLRMIDLRHPTK